MPAKKNAPPRIKKHKPVTRQFSKEEVVELKSKALELYAADESNAKELGCVLVQLKIALKHGEFIKWWKHYNLSQSRVSYCIRLYLGKVTAAKIRRAQSSERIAINDVKKRVNGFMKFVQKASTLDEIDTALGKVCVFLIGGIARVRKWPLAKEEDLHVQKALRDLKQAVSAMLDAALNPIGRAPKQPPQSEPATDAASSAKAGA